MKSSDVSFLLKVLKKTAKVEVMDYLNNLPPDSPQWLEIFLAYVYPNRLGVKGRLVPWILSIASIIGALIAFVI